MISVQERPRCLSILGDPMLGWRDEAKLETYAIVLNVAVVI
jgi:hypothetical protein